MSAVIASVVKLVCLGTRGIPPASLRFGAGRSKVLADGPGASLALLQSGGIL